MAVNDDWPLLLRSGFGNVFQCGRWNHTSTLLIADAINKGTPEAWKNVEMWARRTPWDPTSAS